MALQGLRAHLLGVTSGTIFSHHKLPLRVSSQSRVVAAPDTAGTGCDPGIYACL